MSDTSDTDRADRPWTAQPLPIPHPDEPSMHDLVAADLTERKAFGLRKYGTTLTAGNGRDPLLDAYEEALDLVVYLRQLIEERGGRNAP
jgi:hypothetical protein